MRVSQLMPRRASLARSDHPRMRRLGLSGGGATAASLLLGNKARQAHREHRALARFACHGHVAAHHARELAGDGKAQASAAETLCSRSIVADANEYSKSVRERVHKGIGIGSDEMSTPKLEGLAAYCANLIRLSKEIPEAAELRAELALAMEQFQAELKIDPGETGSGLTWSPPFQ